MRIHFGELVAVLLGLVFAALATGCKHIPDEYLPEIKWPAVVTNALQSTPGAETKPETSVGDVAGIPCAGIPITATISNVRHGGKTTWAMTGTAGWPKKNVKVDVQGQTFLYVWRGDKWQGGKFDWFRPGQTSKGHENIEGNYMKVIPAKGDKVAFGLVDIHKAQRSNFMEGVWP
jgi:hypothetical protein